VRAEIERRSEPEWQVDAANGCELLVLEAVDEAGLGVEDAVAREGEVFLGGCEAMEVDALAAVGSAGANKKKALLEQIDARVLRPLFVYQFPVVKGLLKGPLKGVIPEVAHLRDLVGKMILADLASGRDLTAPIPDAAAGPNLKRELPAPAPELQTAQSKAAAASDHAKRAAAAAQDDPELLGLEKKYKNKKFTDVAEHTKGSKKARAPDERFVMLGIVWSTEHDKWVAECVELDKEDEIPDSKKTAGGRVLKEALEYYLCESLDGMLDAPPSSNESDSE
jgi:hypothetical protein